MNSKRTQTLLQQNENMEVEINDIQDEQAEEQIQYTNQIMTAKEERFQIRKDLTDQEEILIQS